MVVTKRRFNASRGGHAPGHLRDAFIIGLERWFESDGSTTIAMAFGAVDVVDWLSAGREAWWKSLDDHRRAFWLFGQLWNCTDVLSGSLSSVCEDLDIPCTSYGQAVRALRPQLLG